MTAKTPDSQTPKARPNEQRPHPPPAPGAPGHPRIHSPEFYAEAKRHAVPARDGDAFFADPAGHPSHLRDAFAEELAEEFLSSATSGEEVGQEAREVAVPEDSGGPFVESSADMEFAAGTDASNPDSAEPAAFPTVTATVER